MDAERWQKIEALFHAALDASPAERERLLACADPDLRGEVESLLARAGGLPALHLEDIASGSTGGVKHGTMIGSYAVDRLVGHGGMGAVYLARDTRLNRPVAIKALADRFADESAPPSLPARGPDGVLTQSPAHNYDP